MKKIIFFITVFLMIMTLSSAEPQTQESDKESSGTEIASGEYPLRKPPVEFDKQWYEVRPRAEKGIYPNEPPDWQAMPNPRYEVKDGRPLEGLRICVDAGHGGQVWGPTHGYTGGTRGRETGFPESEANLRTAFFLWDLLTQAGAEVTMTRTGPDRMAEPCFAPPKSDEWNRNRDQELYSRVQMADKA